MKRIFAVALLLLSFASAALADGGGWEPPNPGKATKPPIVGVQFAEGPGGMPPPELGTAAKPPIVSVAA